MSKKFSPAAVGVFIVSGLALAIAGVLAFSSFHLFSRPQKFILYFDTSVKGLGVGAPVAFRGVNVGSVVDVLLHFNQASQDHYIPVIIQINSDVLRKKSDRTTHFTDPEEFPKHVARGLRASLKAESLVTGVLFIELFYDSKATNCVLHQEKKIYSEIPTVPAQVEALMDNLAKVDINGLVAKISTLADRLDHTLEEVKLGEIGGRLSKTLASLDGLLSSPELTNSLASIRTTLDDFRLLSEKLRGRVDPLADQATNTLHQAQLSLAELRKGVQDIRALLAPEAPLQQNLNESLEQLAEAARSISSLADYIERNPKALLTGRSLPKSKP